MYNLINITGGVFIRRSVENLDNSWNISLVFQERSKLHHSSSEYAVSIHRIAVL